MGEHLDWPATRLVSTQGVRTLIHGRAWFIGEYLDRPACSIGEHSASQSFCPWARRIRAVAGICQDLIGHDASTMPPVLHGHNRYGGFEGHRKEDVTSKVLDPPFTNLA